MGKVIVSTFVTIDNRMVGDNEDMSWVLDSFDQEMGDEMGDLMSSMQAILIGRVTYAQMSQHWPNTTETEAPGSDQMNHTPKIVFSKTLKSAPWGKWEPAEIAKEIDPDAIQRMKRKSDKNLVIFGSASIVQQFTNLGLVDEYRLQLHPVVLGGGKPLFKDITHRHDLRLISSKIYATGAMGLTLQPKG